MKKLSIILLVMVMLVGCSSSDAKRFKKEYEKLNDTQDEQGKKYPSIEINQSNTIKYVEIEELIDGLNNGTHVIYMGWPTCYWCRRALPVLINTVNKYAGIYIYYYNAYDARLAYENDTKSQLGQDYLSITKELEKDSYDLSPFVDYFADGTMKLPASLVLFVKNGEIIGAHKRTVDSHIDSYEPLSELQQNQLSDIYSWYLDELVKKVQPGCSEC